ncbi:SIS domain protein [Leptospira interrogans serovar Icterohaemorrhagiae str. Verdun HP]|uniref:SIS domain protein n=3 Tax=Leptospira interrogans TaxID=173 RepID=M6RF60_LEPIR|nr:SIS domain protein [Leptospira interrogans serovar Zanoni str. LT2156]EMO03234.1 SIS domain protein [Leptospira interrogans serovar Icterohaemorrhagiae str. Verdun HP]EMY06393.1 SIS domain protein [Leptospira interrogans str. 2002000626]
MLDHYNAYIGRLQSVLVPERASEIERLALSLKDAWETKKQVFLCGNGGSAGNAIHLANDFNYGIDKKMEWDFVWKLYLRTLPSLLALPMTKDTIQFFLNN